MSLGIGPFALEYPSIQSFNCNETPIFYSHIV